jgi:group I intron endonuclease
VLVYALKNECNGKVYVGQTKYHRLSQRWSSRPSVSKANPHLANAIRRYGSHNFSQQVLSHASCVEELNLLERFWIAAFKSSDSRYGYNKTRGGAASWQFTPEIRQTLSQAMREVWRRGTHRKHGEAVKKWWRSLTSAEQRLHRLKQSLARSGQTIRGHEPWNKGIFGLPSAKKGKKYGKQKHPCRSFPPFSEEHKRRISEALKRFHRQRRKAQKNSRGTKAAERRITRIRSDRNRSERRL